MKMLVISKKEVKSLLSMPELILATNESYKEYSKLKMIKSQRINSVINDSSIVVNLPGYLASIPMFTVKVNVKTPSNTAKGLPFLRGCIQLFDIEDGKLLAMMESSLITAMRTGAAGAIGVEQLANPSASQVALIGAGAQGEWQIRALHTINRVSSVYIYDIITSKALDLSKKLSSELGISCYVCTSPQKAVEESNILILTTQSQTSIIFPEMLKPGLHINAFGADQPGKVELDAEVINNSKVYVDDLNIALTVGALNVAYQTQQISSMNSFLEIGDVIEKPELGRTSQEQITVFANTGLAFQDLVACSLIYQQALEHDIGSWIDFD